MKIEKTDKSIKIDDGFAYDLVVYTNENLDDGFYNIEINFLDETTSMPIKKESLVELNAWLTEQLGLGWVSVEDKLPEKETTDLGEEYICELYWFGRILVMPLAWINERWCTLDNPKRDYSAKVRKWRPLPQSSEVTK